MKIPKYLFMNEKELVGGAFTHWICYNGCWIDVDDKTQKILDVRVSKIPHSCGLEQKIISLNKKHIDKIKIEMLKDVCKKLRQYYVIKCNCEQLNKSTCIWFDHTEYCISCKNWMFWHKGE